MSALRARRTVVLADGHNPSRLCVAPCLKTWLVRKVRPQMTEMAKTAVLLVAGVGSRLRPLTDSIPKALVPVGGRSILERAVFALKAHGVETFVFATGYRRQAVEVLVGSWGIDARFCFNECYDSTQNSISLLRCEGALRDKSFFKLDGDLLFDARVIERLNAAGSSLSVAVDGRRKLDEEAMKVRCDGRLGIVDFGKGIPVAEAHGESIGIERLSAEAGTLVFDAIARLETNGIVNRYYEDVYADLIAQGKLAARAIEVGDLAWTEVDCVEDLDRARQLFGE